MYTHKAYTYNDERLTSYAIVFQYVNGRNQLHNKPQKWVIGSTEQYLLIFHPYENNIVFNLKYNLHLVYMYLDDKHTVVLCHNRNKYVYILSRMIKLFLL